MNKPKNPTEARIGTKVYNVLNVVLTEETDSPSFEPFPTVRAAWEYYDDEYVLGVDESSFQKILCFYRDGLYSFKGKYIWEQPINIFSNPSLNQSQNSYTKVEEEIEEEDRDQLLLSFAERCKSSGIDPSEAQGGWVKTKGLSVRVNKNVDEVKELNTLIDKAKENLEVSLRSKVKPKKLRNDEYTKNVGILNLADLHLGAFVNNLTKTPDYSSTILCDRLREAADQVNRLNYETVHIILLGDLIESLGMELAHPSMWKELENGIYGSKAIEMCVDILDTHLLSRINNLGEINIIAGNHDRGTGDNKNDVEGLAAQVISWGLGLMKYKVNFNSLILSQDYDGINYIMLHGDKLLSKRAGKEIAWDYGKQGMFNFILEGHLHSRIQKAQAQKNVETTKIVLEDSGQTRRQNCPSVFTGNRYSEYGGWDALGGYLIIENNGTGKPNVFDFTFTG